MDTIENGCNAKEKEWGGGGTKSNINANIREKNPSGV